MLQARSNQHALSIAAFCSTLRTTERSTKPKATAAFPNPAVQEVGADGLLYPAYVLPANETMTRDWYECVTLCTLCQPSVCR